MDERPIPLYVIFLNLFMLQKKVKFIKYLILQTMHEKLVPRYPVKRDLLTHSIKRQ
jgi:hypothetical protein